jgi:hypothetical protein
MRGAGLVEALTARGQMVVDRGDGPFQRWAPDTASPRAQNVDLDKCRLRPIRSWPGCSCPRAGRDTPKPRTVRIALTDTEGGEAFALAVIASARCLAST